jgi:hypothetical protein
MELLRLQQTHALTNTKEIQVNEEDWILFEFGVHQVLRVEEDRVCSVSDGNFTKTGHELNSRCMPLTLRNLVISNEFEYYSNKLHKYRNLNFPDIRRHLVSLWVRACKLPDIVTDIYKPLPLWVRACKLPDIVTDIYKPLRLFIQDIEDKLQERDNQVSQGVSIFK